MIKLASVYFSCRYNRGFEPMRGNTQLFQSQNFWIFTDFSLGCIEVISCNFEVFKQFFLKSHTIIAKICLCYQNTKFWLFCILGSKCCFWTIIVSSLETSGPLQKQQYWVIKHSLKIWPWSGHFYRFHRYWIGWLVVLRIWGLTPI